MHEIITCLFAFSARFIRLSAAQNALPAGGKPAGSAPHAADKQKNRAEKVNNLSLRSQFKISKKQYGK
jgi:hypothetical protein